MLICHKFTIFIPILGDDTLAAMAEAVEKSDIIIMFMSERYKDSRSCRSGNPLCESLLLQENYAICSFFMLFASILRYDMLFKFINQYCWLISLFLSLSVIKEAEYAYKLDKKVIPILVEDGYNPDGWLGILQGTKLYYKCCTDAQIQKQMPEIVRAIKEPALDAVDGKWTNTSESTTFLDIY